MPCKGQRLRVLADLVVGRHGARCVVGSRRNCSLVAKVLGGNGNDGDPWGVAEGRVVITVSSCGGAVGVGD